MKTRRKKKEGLMEKRTGSRPTRKRGTDLQRREADGGGGVEDEVAGVLHRSREDDGTDGGC